MNEISPVWFAFASATGGNGQNGLVLCGDRLLPSLVAQIGQALDASKRTVCYEMAEIHR